jgi:hypothetical protein
MSFFSIRKSICPEQPAFRRAQLKNGVGTCRSARWQRDSGVNDQRGRGFLPRLNVDKAEKSVLFAGMPDMQRRRAAVDEKDQSDIGRKPAVTIGILACL